MYEVELTAIIKDRSYIIQQLEYYANAPGQEITYDDCYYDYSDTLTERDFEFRLRLKHFKQSGKHEAWLTLKKSVFDQKSRSKPEFETRVDDYEATKSILEGLGYQKDISYTKNCIFFDICFKNKNIEVSLVELPELPDTYIEIELPTRQWDQVDESFKVLYQFLKQLGVQETALSTISYQEAIRASRKKN